MDYIERDAKLFEVGSYPDKGIDVTENDLDTMVGNFKEIPIKVEHVANPLKMGSVKKIWRTGKELFGTLCMPCAAAELMSYSDAKKLSVAMPTTKDCITEVSIVRSPRVPDAAVMLSAESDTFTAYTHEDSIVFTWDAPSMEVEKETPKEKEREESTNMSDDRKKQMSVEEALRIIRELGPDMPEARQIQQFSDEINLQVEQVRTQLTETARRTQEATSALQRANASRLVETFKTQGKITPAAEKFAAAIIGAKPLTFADPNPSHMVTFAGDKGEETQVHFAELFVRFLEAMSPVMGWTELAKQRAIENKVFSSEEESFLRDKLRIDPEKVKKYI